MEYKYNSKQEQLEDTIRIMLELLGEDPSREGLAKTPHRVAKMYQELLEGYKQDIKQIVNGALYDVDISENEMIIIDNITYNSLCEHHMLPFIGKAHVAYIPNSKILGLSKIPRIVDVYAKRLQVQERMTNQIADAIVEVVDPKGVMVFLEGNHSCSALRGVKKYGVNMRTTASRGQFVDNKDLRKEFFSLIKK